MKGKEIVLFGSDTYLLISEEKVDALMSKFDKVIALLESQNSNSPTSHNGWIEEAQAIKKYQKGRSWFGARRREGHFTETRFGSTVYLIEEDIIRYFEKNKRQAFRK